MIIFASKKIVEYIFLDAMEQLPADPFMLMSFINMKLRDEYESLEELCSSMDIDADFLIKTLSDAGFTYSVEQKKFW